jgi:hypothetical protein
MTSETHMRLIDEIEQYLASSGMGEAYFGRRACGNTEVVKRLRSGRDVRTGTADALRAFMAANPPKTADAPQEDAA